MQKSVLLLLTLTALSAMAVSFGAAAQDDSIAEQEIEHTVDMLQPPPLPKLPKGEWKSEKTIFPDALYVEDEQGNSVDKSIDLPGTKYSAHLDYKRHMDALDEDLMNSIASAYDKTLSEKLFESRVKIPGYPYYLEGISTDGSQGGVYGQSVIAQGNLRFIAVGTNEPGGDDESEGAQPVAKDVNVSGDIQIFVSDIIAVPDLIQKMTAKAKTETPEAKEPESRE